MPSCLVEKVYLPSNGSIADFLGRMKVIVCPDVSFNYFADTDKGTLIDNGFLFKRAVSDAGERYYLIQLDRRPDGKITTAQFAMSPTIVSILNRLLGEDGPVLRRAVAKLIPFGSIETRSNIFSYEGFLFSCNDSFIHEALKDPKGINVSSITISTQVETGAEVSRASKRIAALAARLGLVEQLRVINEEKLLVCCRKDFLKKYRRAVATDKGIIVPEERDEGQVSGYVERIAAVGELVPA